MVFRLDNPVRRYAWGSRWAIQALLGQSAQSEPIAELWVGADPQTPCRIIRPDVEASTGHFFAPDAVPGLDQVLADNQSSRLDQVIAAAPEAMLGQDCCQRLGSRLPFLVKLLAVAQPLSLQVHPNHVQAAAGFAAENAAGISLDDPARSYRDPYAKPEIIYALSRLEVVCGLLQPLIAAQLIDALKVPALTGLTDILKTQLSASGEATDEDLAEINRAAFEWLFDARLQAHNWTDQLARSAQTLLADGAGPAYAVVLELAKRYPGDSTVVVPLLLNYLVLEPGQVLFTPAGCLHAYVRGFGLEVMGASDNVLRAGITPKPINPAQVLQIAHFGPAEATLLPGLKLPANQNGQTFTSPQGDFVLTVADLGPGGCIDSPTNSDIDPGPRLVLSLDGEVHLLGRSAALALPAFATAFIPAAAGPVTLVGHGRVALISLVA